MTETERKRQARWRARNLEHVRKYQRDWAKLKRDADPAAARERERARHKPGMTSRQIANRDLLRDLRSVPCVDCGGVFHWCCMDFDHRDPSTKVTNLNRMWAFKRERILAEIAKCDVVCANCHRLRTRSLNLKRIGKEAS
jgi:ferric-dicitrate binding protein FerR (iron transport regulator)